MMMIMPKMIIKSSYVLSLIEHPLYVRHCYVAVRKKMGMVPLLIDFII